MSDTLWPHELYRARNSPGQNAGVGSLSLLQEIFPTRGSSPSLPHCRQVLYQLRHRGRPYNLVAYNETLFSPNFLTVLEGKSPKSGADQGSHLESSRGESLFASSSMLWQSLACGQAAPSLPVLTRSSLLCVHVLSPSLSQGHWFCSQVLGFSSDQFSSVQSLSRVRLFVPPWIAALPGLPVHHQLPEFTQTQLCPWIKANWKWF